VHRLVVDRDGLDAMLAPRTDLVLERAVGDGRFEAAEGPVAAYGREVRVAAAGDGRWALEQTVDFRLAVPYFGWIFVLPFKRALARPERHRPPWWAPPVRLDARAASVLGVCAALAVIFGYLNTLFTQTVAFAAEEFGASNSAQGVAGGVVRAGGMVALVVATTADRRGRRVVVLGSAVAGCVLAVTGALAPSLAWLTGSQLLARAFATALLLLVGIVVAEEMPAGARAYAVSLTAMAGGLGAGGAILALNLADLGPRAWRLLYVIPVLALPALASIRRRLPESRRFVTPHAEVGVGGHGARLWLLAVSGLLTSLFIAPQSQFNGRYLRTEHGFSGGRIALLTLVAGAPGAVGIVVGGRLADVRGRRKVAAVALSVGTVCTVMYFFADGAWLWLWPFVGNMISAASIPALGVYGPELFPTSLRGRANGMVAVVGLAGSAGGLLLAGVLSDAFGRIGPAMALLGVGPLLVAVLVLAAYPETAGRELEELNPEDRPPPPLLPPP
jgi:MFS family permease